MRRAVEHFDAVAELPFGSVGVRTCGEHVEEIRFLVGEIRPMPARNPIAQRAVDQLRAYCADSSHQIDLPLAIGGSNFQRRVWDEIARIPPGSTRTYGELARRLDSAPRGRPGRHRRQPATACHSVSPGRCGIRSGRIRASSGWRIRTHQALAACARSWRRAAPGVIRSGLRPQGAFASVVARISVGCCCAT